MSESVTVVRIYIHEAEHGRRTTLLDEILNLLHDQHRVRGVTVLRGIAGFGSDGEVHTSNMLRINLDLPLVVEFFDTPEVVKAAMAVLRERVPDGHIVHWPASTFAG